MQNSVVLLDRITADSRILAGKPVVRGLRISVEQLLKALAAGQSETDLLAEYPELEVADFQAVLLFASLNLKTILFEDKELLERLAK
jgi:uncharacterized protein (DUF433 family)